MPTVARTPGFKLFLALAVGAALTIPLISVYLLNYDRQSQQQEATRSITSGWGAAQLMSGPVLVIPFRTNATETVVENGVSVTRTSEVTKELKLAPEAVKLATKLRPEIRKRSIYRAVVYGAQVTGEARFVLPPDLARIGIDPAKMDLGRAELRFGLSDPKGLGANPHVRASGQVLRMLPGTSSGRGSGFFGWVDASAAASGPLAVDFAFDFRGNAQLSFAPDAGDTLWKVQSTWPSPSFAGDFLPAADRVGKDGFIASYRIGNLALGRPLARTETSKVQTAADTEDRPPEASISLIQPVDLYSQVERATKYGFLFIGFTFLALLMFDVIGGAPVSPVEYLLMGAALVLFFVMLLAFAEIIGFAAAYVIAAAAIALLNTFYASAVLHSWRRASFIGGLLAGLYALLYVLLSLEAFSLLIGSLLLFAALAGVMYATRRIDWGAPREAPATA